MSEPLPNLRSEVAREHMSDPNTRLRCTVYVDWFLFVRLDALAKERLLRTARPRGITHQEAARCLLANVRPPERPTAS